MLNAAARRFDGAGAAPEGSETMTEKPTHFWGGFFVGTFGKEKGEMIENVKSHKSSNNYE